jgi:hypothetical protein
MLRELGIEFELVNVNLTTGENRDAPFLALSRCRRGGYGESTMVCSADAEIVPSTAWVPTVIA